MLKVTQLTAELGSESRQAHSATGIHNVLCRLLRRGVEGSEDWRGGRGQWYGDQPVGNKDWKKGQRRTSQLPQ